MYNKSNNAKNLESAGKYLQGSVRRTRYLPGGLGTDDALREKACQSHVPRPACILVVMKHAIHSQLTQRHGRQGVAFWGQLLSIAPRLTRLWRAC